MRKSPAWPTLLLLLAAGFAQAEPAITCKGNITSTQGEGMVTRTYRFEVADITGGDIQEVLDNCGKITRQRQHKAGRAKPADIFRKFSQVELECTQGSRKFQVRRTLRTGP